MANSLEAHTLQQVSEYLASWNAQVASQYWLSETPEENADDPLLRSAELILDCQTSKAELRKYLDTIAAKLAFEFVLQDEDQYKHQRKLICFDMDSTLIKTEVIDQLAIQAGVGSQVSEITASAMRGEIDFKTSFRKRMRLLKGLDASVVQEIAANLPMMEGVEKLFKNLKSQGIATAILSGGFTYFAEHLQNKWDIDWVFANTLEVDNGQLTGNAVDPIVDADLKADLLQKLAHDLGINIKQTVAVGDGANDLGMLQVAGLGVAYHAKPIVQQQAPSAIRELPLDALLYVLGICSREITD